MPDAGELAAWGLRPDDVKVPAVELWPEHCLALEVMRLMRTQWRVGFSGETGLDYAALPIVLRIAGVKRADQAQLLDDLRVMERAALEEIHRE